MNGKMGYSFISFNRALSKSSQRTVASIIMDLSEGKIQPKDFVFYLNNEWKTSMILNHTFPVRKRQLRSALSLLEAFDAKVESGFIDYNTYPLDLSHNSYDFSPTVFIRKGELKVLKIKEKRI